MTDVEVYTPPKQMLERLTPEQVRYIANTEIIPKALRGRPEAIMATILKGRSLGLDDINSLSAIHFIEGKAGLSAETMVHLVRKRGHSITFKTEPGQSCTVTGRRRDNGDEGSVTWTIKMAQDAGLASKDVWKRYPDSMLWVRAVSQLCRMLFADVLMGTSYSPEELEEVAERGRVTEAVSDLPGVEEVTVRTEPQAAPSEAQMNRIAHLEERAGGGHLVTLRGVFGVELASELDAEAAGRYEAMLELGLPPDEDSTGEPSGKGMDTSADGQGATDESGEASSSPVDEASGADNDNGLSVTPAPEELPDEPAPEEDEVIEGEAVEVAEVDENLVALAAETVIPIGTYKGKTLEEIHDGWLKYGLENVGRLPAPFVEALELYVRERKPELWEQVRGA